MIRSRMDIQSDYDYKVFNTKNYFKSYLNQSLNVPRGYPNCGKCIMAPESETLSILKDYTNKLYIDVNTYLRNGDYRAKVPRPYIDTKLENLGNGEAVLTVTSFVLNHELSILNAFYMMHKKISSLYFSLIGAAPFKIKEFDDIPRYTTVYRGNKNKPPFYWKVGDEFFFAEFVSTSLDMNIAKSFGDYIFVITLNGTGYKGIERLSYYENEKEVLIAAYSKFKIKNIDGNYYFMDQFDY